MGRMSRTKGGSKVVYTDTFVSGSGNPSFTHTATAQVKGKDGKTYLIPIDKKGKVPEYVLYQRFLNTTEGSRDGVERSVGKDLAKEASKVHTIPKGGFTPEELVNNGWWAYPNESDIKGIDDPSTPYLDVIKGADNKASTMGKIAIIANESEQERIKGILQKDFTKKELKAAIKNGGIVIMTNNPGKGRSGFYMPRQEGIETPMIVLGPGSSEDTIVHEFVHHSRRVDPDRYGAADCPFPTDDSGGQIRDIEWVLKYNPEDAINLEEAATVLEAAGRTKTTNRFPSGYYQFAFGNRYKVSPEEVTKDYQHDRDLMTKNGKKNGPVKGKRAIAKVNDKFDESKISDLHFKGRLTGKQFFKKMSVNGDVSEKPKSKRETTKKSNVATATTTTPGTAMADILPMKGSVKKQTGKIKTVKRKRAKS